MRKLLLILSAVFLVGMAFNLQAYAYQSLFDATLEGYIIKNHYDYNLPSGVTKDVDYYGYYVDDDYVGGDPWSGYYIGTIQGNTEKDDTNRLTALINYYLNVESNDYVMMKVDMKETEEGEPLATDNGLLHVDIDTAYYGDWSFEGKAYELGFYAVKGGTEFALYFVDPAKSSGTWTTRHIENKGGEQPAISHFSVAATPVPEPATMLLLGSGLIGIAVIGRKKFKV